MEENEIKKFMKIVKIDEIENKVKFDNGICMYSYHVQECCENNYIDFSQLKVGDEFEGEHINDLLNAITIKIDGVIIRDINGIPKWLQARSEQNGYYSNVVQLIISDSKYKELKVFIEGEEREIWN